MKIKLLFLLLMLLAKVCWGQKEDSIGVVIPSDTIYKKLNYQKETLLKKYSCETKPIQAVQPKVLGDNLYGIYQAIIPNAQNLSNNSSAFTYSHDQDKQTLGISAMFPFPSKKYFLNTGIYAEASDGIFNLYSSNSWNNNVAFSMGISGVIKSSQYVKDKKECMECISKRKNYADSLLLSYAKILGIEDIGILEKERKSIQSRIDSLLALNNVKSISKDTTDYIKHLKEINHKIERYNELIKNIEKQKEKKYFSEKLAEFDKEKDLLSGYNVYWWQANGSIANTTIKIADSLYTGGTRTEKHPTIQLNVAGMYNHLGKRTLQYISLGFSIKRGNFLNDPTINEDPSIIYRNDVPYIWVDNKFVGVFDDLVKPVWQYTFSLYYANFFLFERSLGFTFKAEYNNIFKDDIAFNYKKNYTLTFGPIFRAVKEENFAKATFGILAGFINTPYETKTKDFFSVQAYIGIPFNALIKKQ